MAFLTLSVLILLSIGVVVLVNSRVLSPTPQTLGSILIPRRLCPPELYYCHFP
jgi:hypothetical protein